MQIGDWGNVLIRHVCEWKHPLWACPFSGVEFCGTFHFQKLIFLQLLQIWSSYCFHCDTDQLWTHTQSNNKTKGLKQILLTVKNLTSPFAHLLALSHVQVYLWVLFSAMCYALAHYLWVLFSALCYALAHSQSDFMISVMQSAVWAAEMEGCWTGRPREKQNAFAPKVSMVEKRSREQMFWAR